MSAIARRDVIPAFSIALPVVVLLASTLGVAWQSGLLDSRPADSALYMPQTATIAPRTFRYRADGEHFKGSNVIDPPMIEVTESRPLTIMKYQVTAADYDACVAEGACNRRAAGATPDANLPVTGVNFDDARAYAGWLSARTGEVWTLPTDRQLAFAAGNDFPDDAFGIDPDNKNPALRWLAEYRRDAAEKKERDPAPRPLGSFGVNEFGVADFGGNVSEWTTTCHRRVQMDQTGSVDRIEPVCGIYVTVGNHRSPMSSFVRDPKGGGCAVGTPPANLGFRLVRDDRWYGGILRKLGISG